QGRSRASLRSRARPSMNVPPMRRTAAILCALFATIVTATRAEPSLDTFRREIRPILDKYCFDCHGNGVDKAGVRLDSFETAAELGDHKLWWRALKNIRAGVMPPADEEPLPPAEAEKIMAWIKREAFGLDPAQPDPGRVTVR